MLSNSFLFSWLGDQPKNSFNFSSVKLSVQCLALLCIEWPDNIRFNNAGDTPGKFWNSSLAPSWLPCADHRVSAGK